MRSKMVHSNTKNAKLRVRQSQVCYFRTARPSALKWPLIYYHDSEVVSTVCDPKQRTCHTHLVKSISGSQIQFSICVKNIY